MLMEDYGRSVLGGLLSSVGLPSILSSSSPTKLSIHYETFRKGYFDGQLKVLFNPNSLTASSSVDWRTVNLAASIDGRSFLLKFTTASVKPPTLSLELLFDTYEGEPGGGGWGSLISVPNPLAIHGFSSPSGVSVLPYTSKIAELTQINRELHRPPHCQVWWGRVLLITGPLTSLTQNFTRFMPDGTPVRAKLNCTFTVSSAVAGRELRSADVTKTHTVKLGDTLQLIAHQYYEDVSLWRAIALANNIDDPRRIEPGSILTIPKLK